MEFSPIDTWAVRFGSIRQLVAIAGRAVTATLRAEIGALVERLAGEAFDLAAEIVVDETGDGAAEIGGLRADLSGHAGSRR
jgi:hypothetical protein